MKHTYSLILCALLAAVTSAQAQDYRPFRMGLTYQLSESATPGDTTHTLRLTSASRVGADSVFQFNPMTQGITGSTSNCFGTHVQRANNLFGATLTVPGAGSDFVLTASNGRSITLKPRAALNQLWPAAPGLTATVSALGVAPVLGQLDSVVTITFSNNQQLRLSKHYGLVEGPSLVALLDGRYRSRALALTALPELQLGTSYMGPKAVYDFQPQDVFLRHSTSMNLLSGDLCSESWVRDSVLTRTTSVTGDSIIYTIWSRSLQIGHGVAGAPATYCSVAGTTLFPSIITTLVVTNRLPATLGQLTNYFDFQGNGQYQFLNLGEYRTSQFNNRMEQHRVLRSSCSTSVGDSIFITLPLDNGGNYSFAEGLGLTHHRSSGIYSAEFTELIGYRQNGTTHGQLRSFVQLLPTAVARPAATTAAFPNPFANELTVKFELARPQVVALELRDALGRVVLAQPGRYYAVGTATMQLTTGKLPAGLYTAVLRPADGPAQLLKVVKTL